MRHIAALSLALWPLNLFAQDAPRPVVSLSIDPGTTGVVTLRGPDASQQLLITGKDADGRVRDVTREVRLASAPSGVVAIDAGGLVTPVKEGKATITAVAGDKTAQV